MTLLNERDPDAAAIDANFPTTSSGREKPPRRRTLSGWVAVVAAVLPVAALTIIIGGRAALHAWQAAPPARVFARAARPAYAWARATGPSALVHEMARAPWGTLYAGTTQGVEASADEGRTWRPFGQGFPGPGIEAWGVTALTGRTNAGSGGDAVLATCQDGYVYRLARAGGRWTRSERAIGTYSTAIYAPPGDSVLAGSDTGIYRSADSGRSWAQAARIPGGAVAAFARDTATGAIYAGVAGRRDALRLSTDGGRRWRVPAGPPPPPSVQAVLALRGNLYTGAMGAGYAVWTGATRGFARVGRGLSPAVHGMALAATGETGGTGGRLFMGSMGMGAYMASYTSTQGTRAYGPWTRLGPGPGDGVVTVLLVLPGRRPVLLAGTGDGIYRLRLP